MIYDAIIVGGGACGLMCAVQAAKQGKNILLVERNDRLGAKILISGGGRCNYTNLHTSYQQFVSEDPQFARNVLAQWTVGDTIDFFEEHGISGKEKTLGQLFPVSDKARDVVAVFERLLRQYAQPVWTNSTVMSVSRDIDEHYVVSVDRDGEELQVRASSLVIASGGLPVAKLGASDFGLRVARQFGLPVVQTAPALVPLTITGKDEGWFAALSGNSIFCRVSCGKVVFEENILFTHWGLSGPAILQISSYWRPGSELIIDFLPTQSMDAIIREERNLGGKRLVSQMLHDYFPRRFVEALSKFLPLETKIASLSKVDAKKIATVIHGFSVKPAGDKGYDKAEVMRGGVSTSALWPDRLETREVKGLFFGGECIDMTGWLGGYNFQWAWASGYAIAQHI